MFLKSYIAPETELVEIRVEANILTFSRNADNNENPDDTGEEEF